MLNRFYNWLHGQWPAGKVEPLPIVGERGATNLSRVRVVGDLSGVPLLKFSSETGVQAIRAIVSEKDFHSEQASRIDDTYDVAIIGGGVSGLSAAMEAEKHNLKYVVFESHELLNTIKRFPAQKPIFTYPSEMTPSGGVQYSTKSDIKEALLEDIQQQLQDYDISINTSEISHLTQKGKEVHLHHQSQTNTPPTKALHCIVAIGRSGKYRTLNIPGEELPKVMPRLHDPQTYSGAKVAVIGGGDSAIESAISLSEAGADVTLCYRKASLSRPKPANQTLLKHFVTEGRLTLALSSTPIEITEDSLRYQTKGKEGTTSIANNFVFTMIGREAPLEFFRRSGIHIAGERTPKWWITAAFSVLFFTLLYLWKGYDSNLDSLGISFWTWPAQMPQWMAGLNDTFATKVSDRSTLLGTLAISMKSRSFYYTLGYCLLVTFFGLKRIQRRKTPYVTRQTLSLMTIQWLPLFLIPEIVLPYLGYQGVFTHGSWWDGLFEPYISSAQYTSQEWPDWGHPRAYWRAYGFILAWPLFVYNLFTDSPMWIWLSIGLIQTFVIIPQIVRRWGKGAYCGWICSCGALAETVGDTHRHKMPHGPLWNKLNLIGQIFLASAFGLFILRIISWIIPGTDTFEHLFQALFSYDKGTLSGYFSYGFIVDLVFAGILGVAFYTHLSGRVWCRFACPLAALMHIYARFGKFRIFSNKKKCISCNVCTSVCHQGIDIMSVANKGIPMQDPQCVRCSACVQQCPTGVLSFGRLGKDGDPVIDGIRTRQTE